MKKRILFLMMILIAITYSCNDNDDNPESTKNLTVNISGLEDLGMDYVYEGWIIVNGAPVSTGTFTSTDLGQTFLIESDLLDSATRFVLTIEPAGETGAAITTPSDTKLMVGDFSGNAAALSINTVGDFNSTTPSGKFFLRSPTDETGTNNGNDQNGIWFGNPGMPPSSGFTLPTLADGWKYEGWVVVAGVGPLSTGTFTAFDSADANATSTTSFGGGENPGPPVPGEDFFNNAPSGFTFPLDVRGRTVVISIEPSPDNSPNPFLLKPLVGTAGQETAPTTYDLGFNQASFPTGSVSR